MDCFFCKKPMSDPPGKGILITGRSVGPTTEPTPSNYIDNYYCIHNDTKICHRFFDDKLPQQVNYVYFTYTYKQTIYSLYYLMEPNVFSCIAFPIGGSTFKDVFKLDFHPDITPENVAAKLPLYLNFL